MCQKQGRLPLRKQDWLCSCVYCIKYRFAVIRSSLFSLELKTSSCLISLYSDYTDTTSFPHADTELNIHPGSHDTFTTSCAVSISQVLFPPDPMNITGRHPYICYKKTYEYPSMSLAFSVVTSPPAYPLTSPFKFSFYPCFGAVPGPVFSISSVSCNN